jgi:hypothetical protein
VKVSIKFWKLQTIFKTFKPKEKVLDGFKLPAPQECNRFCMTNSVPSLYTVQACATIQKTKISCCAGLGLASNWQLLVLVGKSNYLS